MSLDADLATLEIVVRFTKDGDAALRRLGDRLSEQEAEITRLRQERDAARIVPPLIRQTLEKALRSDMTQPPATRAELRTAIDLLPASPSFYSSVAGIEQLAEAQAEVARLQQENEWLSEALREYAAKPGGLLRLIERREAAERDLAKVSRISVERAERIGTQERELARLREGLRDIAASDATSPESLRSYARALLAEDGAAPQRHGRGCGCTPCKAEDWDAVEARLAEDGAA